jgi:hypothetical protein
LSSDWLVRLRQTFDATFETDWAAHAREVNLRFGFKDDQELWPSFPDLPLFWFNGDVEAVDGVRWTLVISLNHQKGRYADIPRRDDPEVSQKLWDFCRNHNTPHWYTAFYRPLVRLSAAILGVDAEQVDEKEFATRRMVFVELIPYASRSFKAGTAAELVSSDRGCEVSNEMTALLIAEAQPSLVLVNGVDAITAFERTYGTRLRDWQLQEYQSSHGQRTKNLWHKRGRLDVAGRRIPVVGFPFLRKRSTHNSYAEIKDLGSLVRAFLNP